MELILRNCKLVVSSKLNLVEGVNFISGLVQITSLNKVDVVPSSNYRTAIIDVSKYSIGTKFYLRNLDSNELTTARTSTFASADNSSNKFYENISVLEKTSDSDLYMYVSVHVDKEGNFGVFLL